MNVVELNQKHFPVGDHLNLPTETVFCDDVQNRKKLDGQLMLRLNLIQGTPGVEQVVSVSPDGVLVRKAVAYDWLELSATISFLLVKNSLSEVFEVAKAGWKNIAQKHKTPKGIISSEGGALREMGTSGKTFLIATSRPIVHASSANPWIIPETEWSALRLNVVASLQGLGAIKEVKIYPGYQYQIGIILHQPFPLNCADSLLTSGEKTVKLQLVRAIDTVAYHASRKLV